MKVTYLSLYPGQERLGTIIRARDLQEGDLARSCDGRIYYKRSYGAFYLRYAYKTRWYKSATLESIGRDPNCLSIRVVILSVME